MVEMIFIGGCPRSGTTLVQRLFGAHAEIYGGPEFDFAPPLARLHAEMQATVDSGRIAATTDAATVQGAFQGLFETMFAPKAAREGARFFCEKTPDNLLVFSELGALFPQARFVFVLRDPRSVYASMKKVGARMHKNLGFCPPAYRHPIPAAAEIDRYWAAGRAAAEMLGDRMLTLHYEDVVLDPDGVAHRICDFLGVAFDPGMVAIENSRFETADAKSIENTYTLDALQKGIDTESLEKYRTELSAVEIALLEHAITPHPDLARYGLAKTPMPPGARARRAAYRMRTGTIAGLRRAFRAVAG